MELAIATNNKNKLVEIRAILGDCFDKLLSMGELGLDVEIEETGSTLAENALIKARVVRDLTGMTSLADDTGLMVDALNGEPGVYSARYAGDEHNDAKNTQKLLENLIDVPPEMRTAHFATVIAVCFADGRELLAEGRVDGYITTELRGTRGFGYDPVFFSTELNKSFGEVTIEEKNSISHRSRALHAMVELLKDCQ